MPVVVIAPRDPWYEKMFSQIEQARARGGEGYAEIYSVRTEFRGSNGVTDGR